MQMKEDIAQCIKVLRAGGVILYPTDTVWGIGCDATNSEAVARVYALKRRADSKAMIVLLDSVDHLDHYVVDVPEMARELFEVAVTPLTLIMDGAYNVSHELLGENDSLGVRIPQDVFCQRLCSALGRPLVSTSANLSGAPTPSTFSEIAQEIKDGVDYIAEHRRDDTTSHATSNIIKLNGDGTFKIIR